MARTSKSKLIRLCPRLGQLMMWNCRLQLGVYAIHLQLTQLYCAAESLSVVQSLADWAGLTWTWKEPFSEDQLQKENPPCLAQLYHFPTGPFYFKSTLFWLIVYCPKITHLPGSLHPTVVCQNYLEIWFFPTSLLIEKASRLNLKYVL